MPVRPPAPLVPDDGNAPAADQPPTALFASWTKRKPPMILDMGEGSREQGFRLNGSR